MAVDGRFQDFFKGLLVIVAFCVDFGAGQMGKYHAEYGLHDPIPTWCAAVWLPGMYPYLTVSVETRQVGMYRFSFEQELLVKN